jgi:hypothetical protein
MNFDNELGFIVRELKFWILEHYPERLSHSLSHTLIRKMKKAMAFLGAAVMLIMMVGGQTDQPPPSMSTFTDPFSPPPPPPSLPEITFSPPSTPESDHLTVTTTSPVTINIYIPNPAAEPSQCSHNIVDVFFFVFGFVGLILLAILCIIMWLVFRILGRRI